MVLGNIVGQRRQPTSTNGPQKTNAANHKLGGREVKKLSNKDKLIDIVGRARNVKSKLGIHDNRRKIIDRQIEKFYYHSNEIKFNKRNDKYFNLTRRYEFHNYYNDLNRADGVFGKDLVKVKHLFQKIYNKTLPRAAVMATYYRMKPTVVKIENERIKLEGIVNKIEGEIDKNIQNTNDALPVSSIKDPLSESDSKADETKQ